MAESSGAPDPVKICFGHFGEIEVDNDVDGLNVDTAGEQVCKTKGERFILPVR